MAPTPGVSTEADATDAESPPARVDVAVVGGGPAGAAAAIFTARYGLETVVFDAGPSSLRRCAYLTNYLGFPGGVDVETFLDLAHAHVREAGAILREERVEAIERPDSEARFAVELAGGGVVAADAVIAATRSGGEYLRPLGGDAMFETHEYDGEVHEHFDPEYADVDGRTPTDGLYVASPAGERDVQAIVAAGQGAHVARRLLADRRHDRGYPEGLDEVYDWLRPDSEFAGEWGERDGWREWFESRLPEDADLDDPVSETEATPDDPVTDDEADAGDVDADEIDDADAGDGPRTLRDLREAYVDQALATRRSPEAIEELSEAGVAQFVETFGADRLLDAMDADEIAAHLADREGAELEVRSDG